MGMLESSFLVNVKDLVREVSQSGLTHEPWLDLLGGGLLLFSDDLMESECE